MPIDVLDMVASAGTTASNASCDSASVSFESVVGNSPSCLPWPADWTSAHDLDARIESRALKTGVIGRLRCAPAATVSFLSDAEEPSKRSIHALYVLSGKIGMEQVGHASVVTSRGIIAFDASQPAKVTLRAGLQHDIISLTIPRRHFAAKGAESAPLGGILVTGHASTSLLSNSLRLIAEYMVCASKDELNVLFEACTSLIALAAHQCTDQVAHGDCTQDNYLLRAILDYADRNVADTALCPAHVSQRFGISTRYLHKLFRASGTTFCTYVLNRRLEHIRSALAATPSRPQPIAALAVKWGFKDVSTFNKAFKKRFGCAPRDLRAHSRC